MGHSHPGRGHLDHLVDHLFDLLHMLSTTVSAASYISLRLRINASSLTLVSTQTDGGILHVLRLVDQPREELPFSLENTITVVEHRSHRSNGPRITIG